ncbi:MAG: type IV pilus secretin family protein [Thioalkalivibrio sp.]|nr:MAG: type IV pilus secretin family protein [Thioalkalivibrio sp.]
MRQARTQWRATGAVLLWLASLALLAAAPLSAQELQDVRATGLGSGQTQLALQFSDAPPDPNIFVIDSPPRIALDLPGVSNRLAARTTELNIGPLESVTAVEAGERTRVVVNLNQGSDYRSRVEGNNLILTIGAGVARAEPVAATPEPRAAAEADPAPGRAGVRSARPPEIMDVDFRRGEEGQGRVMIELSRPGVSVEVQEQAGRVELVFPRVLMDDDLVRRMNVVDFATPVVSIDTARERDERVRMVINTTGEYDVLSYQADRNFVIELAPLSEEEREAIRVEREEFVGERLSLNFQDIEVRSVLQLLADFTDLNIVVSDTVTGNITLRLNNVPWDQALDIVLRVRDLDKRMTGNVIYVAPREEIAQRERRELEALKEQEDLAPLRTEFISVNFTQAESIRRLIHDRDRGRTGDGTDRRMSFLSDRGSVSVDARTNTLIIRDTQEQIESIRRLVQRLDVATQQVLIETRVVIADDNFRRDLGVRFGVTGFDETGRTRSGVSGTLDGSDQVARGGGIPAINDRLNVALPVPDAPSVAFTILRPDLLLDLELSALQVEGRGEIISSPRVITANGETATIKQGQEIPFLSVGDQGTQVEFRDAVLLTEVTPQITPNGNVIMAIRVTKDEPDFSRTVQGNPLINKREVETQVVVANGETVVLGGVYEITNLERLESVPFFGDLPILGNLFRNRTAQSDKAELLVFVTPRVLD